MTDPENLVSSGAVGIYRISVYLEKVASGDGTVSVQVKWTDDALERTRVVDTSGAGANLFTSDVFTIYLAEGENITYKVLTPGSHETRARIHAEAS